MLHEDEPPAYSLVNGDGRSRLVLLCDHASHRVPRSLNNLGLAPEQLRDHIGWDAGTAELGREFARRVDAALILSNYSRLVIDCNRCPTAADSIPTESDKVSIPGNACVDSAQRQQRQAELFQPYHQAISAHLDNRLADQPVLLSIHSFTPRLQGRLRPWSIGVCYGEDRRLADHFLAVLPRHLDCGIGDNEPYAIEPGIDHTLPHHAGTRGLLHVMLEFSRDELQTAKGVGWWAGRLAAAWVEVESLLVARDVPMG